MLVIKIFLIILLADFATGIFHFYVDQYAEMNPSYFASAINGLLIHHDYPMKMTALSYWNLTKGVYAAGGIIFVLSLLIGFYWEVLLFVGVGAQANLIHKWSHQHPLQLPKFARILQRFYIIQNANHHLQHHNGKYNQYYCVMTIFCNPFLERIKFWKILIWSVALFGINPKKEQIVRSNSL
jgi:hypothetical protein